MGAGLPYHSFFYPVHREENYGYVDVEHTYFLDTPGNTYRDFQLLQHKINKIGLALGINLETTDDTDRRHDALIALRNEYLKVLVSEDEGGRLVLGLVPAQDYEEFMDDDKGEAYWEPGEAQNKEYAEYLVKYCEQATAFIQALYKALSKTQSLRVRSGAYMSSLVPAWTKETGMQHSELHFNSFRLNLLPMSALV